MYVIKVYNLLPSASKSYVFRVTTDSLDFIFLRHCHLIKSTQVECQISKQYVDSTTRRRGRDSNPHTLTFLHKNLPHGRMQNSHLHIHYLGLSGSLSTVWTGTTGIESHHSFILRSACSFCMYFPNFDFIAA